MPVVPKRRCNLSCLLFFGLIILISGVCLLFLTPTIMKCILESKLGMSPNSKVFNIWKKSDGSTFMEIFFHNWTNPGDGHDPTVKPKFEEIGPFRFREFKEKLDVSWNDDETISYKQKKKWIFDRNSSCCSLSTKLTTLNAVLVTMSHKSKDWSFPFKSGINLALKALTPNLYVTRNASELLFEGYVDPLLEMSTLFPVKSVSPDGKFGWFYGKNDSAGLDGKLKIDVSAGGKGTMKTWNGFPETKYFKGLCSKVLGSNGEIYPPGRTRDKALFFSPDMCRSVTLDYEKDIKVHGITGYKYIAHKSMLDNGSLVPENECFCNGMCMPSGVLNMSSCRHDSPSFISLPHFLHADPMYVHSLDGIIPERDRHQFFVVLEPNTGLPLKVAARIQLNMHLKPIDYMTLINDVPNVMFPILWFQVQAEASNEFASQLKMLFSLPIVFKSIAAVLLTIGPLITTYALYGKRRDRELANIEEREQVPLKISKIVN
ncbi:PREDICTED: protein croquemort-like isoform X2 [Nicrophorus vespilloides]|nr:PREDICTED: protein croquemort-like isoform X2 [Nicrophorus vespilloides]XP_017774849.1 PREDICTED: protein croquemort-like isoform X2 [Nicrophorus vespilloides]